MNLILNKIKLWWSDGVQVVWIVKSCDIANNDCSERRPIDLLMNLFKKFIQ